MTGSDNPDWGLDDLHISACDAQGRDHHLSLLCTDDMAGRWRNDFHTLLFNLRDAAFIASMTSISPPLGYGRC